MLVQLDVNSEAIFFVGSGFTVANMILIYFLSENKILKDYS